MIWFKMMSNWCQLGTWIWHDLILHANAKHAGWILWGCHVKLGLNQRMKTYCKRLPGVCKRQQSDESFDHWEFWPRNLEVRTWGDVTSQKWVVVHSQSYFQQVNLPKTGQHIMKSSTGCRSNKVQTCGDIVLSLNVWYTNPICHRTFRVESNCPTCHTRFATHTNGQIGEDGSASQNWLQFGAIRNGVAAMISCHKPI